MREEFEKWYVSKNAYCDFLRWNDDKYCSVDVQNKWEAYQAGYIQRGQDDIKTNGVGDCSGSTK